MVTPDLIMLLLIMLVLVALNWLGVRRDVLGAVGLIVLLIFAARLLGLGGLN